MITPSRPIFKYNETTNYSLPTYIQIDNETTYWLLPPDLYSNR